MRHSFQPKLMLASLALFAWANCAQAGIGCTHLTDGLFGPGEWGCPTVSKVIFAPPGAALYVDQGAGNDNTLYLMYDFPGGVAAAASFFDVFFEVVPESTAYLVRIPNAGPLQAFERPIGPPAPLLPNGSFDIGPGSGWTGLTPQDLLLANFHGALGSGPSPDLGTPHPMAEFQLSINRPGPPGGSGIYDPAPAFWGASEKSNNDPPISSAIFTLNPDGTTTVLPVLGPNGAPVSQGTVTPEPATFFGLTAGALGLVGLRRLRGTR